MRLFIKKLISSFQIIPPKEKAILFILILTFLGSSFGFVLKMNSLYSVEVPAEGGTLYEGVIGSPRFINPLLSVSDTDRDLVKLMYAGLFESDGKGGLAPMLALRYDISEDGLAYTVYLNKKAKWHDGESVKVADIAFTVKRAKNPASNSFQRANWEGVEVEVIDDHTARFILKKPYAPFVENLTLPLFPKHIWENTLPEEMSLSNFNLEPVGSGPYKIKKIYRNSAGLITSYKLKANKDFAAGRPYVKYLNILFFSSEDKIIDAFRENKINASGFVSTQNIKTVLNKKTSIRNLMLPRVFGLFFNSANNQIFENKEVRKALSVSLDKKPLIEEALRGYGTEVDSPIPAGSIGGVERKIEDSAASLEQKRAEAKKILEKAGWRLNAEGIYEKIAGKKTSRLEFNISTSNSPELARTAEILKETWESMGARVAIKIFEIGDLNQTVIKKRNYEILLFGEVVGRDPDPFSFWHSSQRADPGLNIAMYANSSVDKVLEEARAETDLEKRIEKYKKFQSIIKEDEVAIFLYSPYFVYITPLRLSGFGLKNISAPQERFSLINKWYIYKDYVWPVFLPGKAAAEL